MTKEFVSYEIAVELKKLGFKEPCLGAFNDKKEILSGYCKTVPKGFLKVPLYQQAFRWFREQYEFNSHIHQESWDNYSYCCGLGYSDEIGGYQDFKTYEEAETKCLKQLIKLAKK